ncbi:DUF3596 domain-containing protein [Arsenophonus nasoniae]|uniref:DUF3596 domain-containing protein n=1 Tax=Arsenophonus nasoniae TaxID=638 RepID=A0A4P7KW01_9GAMM|nr:site-specific integrase [Arsenophonus nasoniae]QBY44459.1 Tn916 family transposase [Arsenophonus nasoniae]WGM04714.1 DUF3596 domain-containing protein [Arsenophonus nasoniae]WGM09830.1 DUF3596 domain-containing protein [Arsenophonus nasoniae]WGM14549.1 DUF3596 domain-containing protein [Arsenophonus nasoniae]
MGQKEQNKLPRGITIRQHKKGETIVLTFTYKGILCREPLSGLQVNNKNIKYAERLLGEIQNNIKLNNFNYVKYFPHSKKLILFGISTKEKRVIDYLNEYIMICKKRQLSPSTINGYKKCINALMELHNIQVRSLTPAVIKNWIQRKNTTLKTIRNQLSFLRSAIDEAITDGLININPVSQVTAARYHSNNTSKESIYVIDPLSPSEVELLLSATKYKQWENLFQFAINTGLRSSELCALRWDDIDFVQRLAYISSASVVGIIKGTKTKSGTRKVELNDQAILALQNQKPFTFLKTKEIFEDPKTKKPWAGADAIRKKAWMPTLRKAGIRYRNPYQTRHTFATRHISQGANLFWLAAQMGHKGPEMLFRHYGSYLKEYDGNATKSVKASAKK